MFERFTDRARRAVVLAQDEARHLGHSYIGIEHLMLGLLAEDEGVAATVLKDLDVSYEDTRNHVREDMPPSETPPGGHLPFTAQAKDALDKALREALQLGHNYIGTEHVLLGLIRPNRDYTEVVDALLDAVGTDRATVRRAVIEKLSDYRPTSTPTPTAPAHGDVALLPLSIDAINAKLDKTYTVTGIVLWWVTAHPDIDGRRPCDVLDDHQAMFTLLKGVA